MCACVCMCVSTVQVKKKKEVYELYVMWVWENSEHKPVCERIDWISAKYGARRKYEIDEKWLCVQKLLK